MSQTILSQNTRSRFPPCHHCGAGSAQIGLDTLITENLITRRASEGDGELTYCTGCIRALGLDWCCRCYRWRPADQIDPETEICPECRAKS